MAWTGLFVVWCLRLDAFGWFRVCLGGCYCSELSILRCLSIAVANKHVLVMFCGVSLLVVAFNNVVVFLMFFVVVLISLLGWCYY